MKCPACYHDGGFYEVMKSPQRLSDHEVREVRCKVCHTVLDLFVTIGSVYYRNPLRDGRIEKLSPAEFVRVRDAHMGYALHPHVARSLER